jgi:hypothetical protein
MIDSRIFGRDANSDVVTFDTTAVQPDSWYVQAPAALVCSLWVLPETVMIGESVTLHMEAENIGGASGDSVSPDLTLLGTGGTVLESGPTPPYTDIAPGAPTVFLWSYTAEDTGWVYWTGHVSGTDHNTQSIVTSPEDTSNAVLILPGFLRADADSSMTVEMSDAIFTLQALYVPGSPQPSCMDAADSDDGGSMEMSDAIFTLKHLYVPGSPAPPAPFPDCGYDPTLDGLDCGGHPCMDGGTTGVKEMNSMY